MKKKIRIIKIKEQHNRWYLHQQVATFAESLNRMADAGEVKKQKTRSAPIALLDMVF